MSLGNTFLHYSNLKRIQIEKAYKAVLKKEKLVTVSFAFNLMKLDTWKKITHNTLLPIPEEVS